MPARSQAQRGYLAVHKGLAWMREHGFANKGELPARAPKHKGPKRTRGQITARQKLVAEFMNKHAGKPGGARGRTVR
jgi:hypothetical protein